MSGTVSTGFYNSIAVIYPVIDACLMPQKLKFYRIINEQLPGNLLEIGVGNGSHLKFLTKHRITGIDTSERMLNFARRNANKETSLLVMDGTHTSFADASFNYIVLSHILSVVKEPNLLLEEAYRILKPGGKLFILNHFTPNNFLSWFDFVFNIVSPLFCFRSYFRPEHLKALNNFILSYEESGGLCNYFRIQVYEKSL
jgi:phosphatidylethanolamine/phosphatidyl-N-methylethanolamine N-methyltransferase